MRWLLGLVVGCSVGITQFAVALDWAPLLQGEHRAAENVRRDPYRHPQQTLEFFELAPAQTVVEIAPGAGWYTELLAPLLRERGKLYAAHFDPQSTVPYFRQSLQGFQAKLAAAPAVYDRVALSVFAPPDKLAIAPAGSADRVLTFRNVHNWVKAGTAEPVFAAMYRALRPGGILGVVEHRAKPDTDLQTMMDSGYITEAKVKELAVAAGYRFVGSREVNANPNDDTRHPGGVWTLPPTLRLGAQDRDRYLAIGESDRMTLKFVKPQ
jgi:predicted methyltransferase